MERYACLIIAKPEKLDNKSTDDSVISFHVLRGLLLSCLVLLGFLRPQQ